MKKKIKLCCTVIENMLSELHMQPQILRYGVYKSQKDEILKVLNLMINRCKQVLIWSVNFCSVIN
jgi:hypothetical protein